MSSLYSRAVHLGGSHTDSGHLDRVMATLMAAGKPVVNLTKNIQLSVPVAARSAASSAALSNDNFLHETQGNDCRAVPDFARRFVQPFIKIDTSTYGGLNFLPLAGIKSLLPLVPLACAIEAERPITVVSVNPGQGGVAIWKHFQGISQKTVVCEHLRRFHLAVRDLEMLGLMPDDLIMINYPHNLSGAVATERMYRELCDFACQNGLKIFNHAGLAAAAWAEDHVTLTDVALQYGRLSWAEAFSATALGFGGWRVGALSGSTDFVAALAKLQAEIHAGPVSFTAFGVIEALEQPSVLKGLQSEQQSRTRALVDLLSANGLRLASPPGAGAGTLWLVPNTAFGQKMVNAEHFNLWMLNRQGIAGVPHGQYIRYVAPAKLGQYEDQLGSALRAARPSY